VLRLPSGLHARLKSCAEAQGVSLNQLCVSMLEAGLRGPGLNLMSNWPETGDVLEAWREELEGLLVFGSSARRETWASSDLDLLLVVRPGVELARGLYRRWDEFAQSRGWSARLSPQFARLPGSENDAGSLWLEAAVDGILVWDRDLRVSRFLGILRLALAEGKMTRRYVHGQPYWVKPRPAA